MKQKKLLVISAMVLLMSACSQILPPSIDSSKAMGELVADLQKISSEYEILNVRITEKDKLSGEFGLGFLELKKGEEYYKQTLYYNYGIPHNDPEKADKYNSFLKKKANVSINVDDIAKEKDNMTKYVETAKLEITEGYSFKSVGEIVFYINDDGDFEIQFEINFTEDGKSTRMKGGREVIDYYTWKFFVDKEGKVF